MEQQKEVLRCRCNAVLRFIGLLELLEFIGSVGFVEEELEQIGDGFLFSER